MATQAGTAYIAVEADLSKFNREVDTGTKQAGGKISGFAKTAGAAMAGAFVASKAKDFLSGAVGAARESAQIMAQTEAVIKSTGGAAGISADEIGDLATAISNKTAVDDEAIQSGANLLLTFRNIANAAGDGNAIFDRTTAAAVDMSAAMGTDMKSSAIQLGKALNDPVKGVAALGRVGIQFTDQQKEQIKTMTESGDLLGAQKIVLAEVETQFKGSAAAQATGADRLKVAWGNFEEMIGGLLLPAVEKLMTWLSKLASWATEHPKTFAAIAIVIGGAVVAAFVAWAVAAATAIAANIAATAVLIAGWIAAAAGALAGAAAVALAWLIAIGPIALVIAAIVGLVVIIVKNWDSIKAAFAAAIDWIWAFIKKWWPVILTLITGGIAGIVIWVVKHWDEIKAAFGAAIDWISEKVGALVGFFTGLGARISDAVSGMWDGVKNAFRNALNWIIDKWNDFQITLGGQQVKFAGMTVDIPQFDLKTPDIQRFHEGGTFHAATAGGEGLALLRDGERVLTPEQQGAAGVTVNVNGAGDASAVAEQVARTLEWRQLSTAGR